MGSAGLNPHEDDKPSIRVSQERLEDFDRVMAEGGIEAVIESLEEREAGLAVGRRPA